MEDWREVLACYANELDIMTANFQMMGALLDRGAVVSRFRKKGVTEFYIYGGAYLGIQLYQAVSEELRVPSIVDKNGGLLVHVPQEIPVIRLDRLPEVYAGEAVVITLPQYYDAIRRDLEAFVPSEKIFYIGEFLGGLV